MRRKTRRQKVSQTGRERVRDPKKPRSLGGKRVQQPDPLPQQIKPTQNLNHHSMKHHVVNPPQFKPPREFTLRTEYRYRKAKNRLIKFCYVPATSAAQNRLLFFFFLLRLFTVLMKQTRQALSSLYS